MEMIPPVLRTWPIVIEPRLNWGIKFDRLPQPKYVVSYGQENPLPKVWQALQYRFHHSPPYRNNVP